MAGPAGVSPLSSKGVEAALSFFGILKGRTFAGGPQLPADYVSNNVAEQHAIIVGIAWYLGLQWPGRLVIHPDNTLAAEVATSESVVASNRDTAYLLAGLHQLATVRAGSVAPEYSHVNGPRGHPWNVLADWAASGEAD